MDKDKKGSCGHSLILKGQLKRFDVHHKLPSGSATKILDAVLEIFPDKSSTITQNAQTEYFELCYTCATQLKKTYNFYPKYQRCIEETRNIVAPLLKVTEDQQSISEDPTTPEDNPFTQNELDEHLSSEESKCVMCYNCIKNPIDQPGSLTYKIYSNCCKRLNYRITKGFTNRLAKDSDPKNQNEMQIPFCQICLDKAFELTSLSEQLESVQRDLNELVATFGATIVRGRRLAYKRSRKAEDSNIPKALSEGSPKPSTSTTDKIVADGNDSNSDNTFTPGTNHGDDSDLPNILLSLRSSPPNAVSKNVTDGNYSDFDNIFSPDVQKTENKRKIFNCDTNEIENDAQESPTSNASTHVGFNAIKKPKEYLLFGNLPKEPTLPEKEIGKGSKTTTTEMDVSDGSMTAKCGNTDEPKNLTKISSGEQNDLVQNDGSTQNEADTVIIIPIKVKFVGNDGDKTNSSNETVNTAKINSAKPQKSSSSSKKSKIESSTTPREKTTATTVTTPTATNQESNSYTCAYCQLIFRDSDSLLKHMRQKNHYTCEVCKKSYPNLPGLRQHQKFHTAERPYKCSECSQAFITMHGLRGHRKTHSAAEKAHKCPECSETFNNMSEMLNHSRGHKKGKKEEKSYECKKCSKWFNIRKNLQKHMASHTK